MLSHDPSAENELARLSPVAKKNLKSASNWARFISILGLAFFALWVISYLVRGGRIPLPGSPEWSMMYNLFGFAILLSFVVFLLGAGIQIYFYIQTLLFGNHAKNAASFEDKRSLFPAFTHLANSFWIMALGCMIFTVYLVIIIVYIYQKFWMFL